jgi:putative membrane protein
MRHLQAYARGLVIGALGLAACGGSHASAAAAEQQAGSPSSPEHQALSKLYLTNQTEIQMAQLAQQKGQSDEVRQYGQQLSSDHSSANQEVQQLAQEHGIQLSAATQELSKDREEMQKKFDALQQAQGDDFDREFLDTMVDSHKRTIDKLSKLQRDVQDPTVRQLIDKSLPKLQQHQDQAEQLKRQIG